jgi:HEPN domain-containing protein
MRSAEIYNKPGGTGYPKGVILWRSTDFDARAAYVVALPVPPLCVKADCSMTIEQLLVEQTHAWLTRGRRDLHAATVLIAAKAYEEALLNCQQAAEKAIESSLAVQQRPFRRTHGLREFVSECPAIDGSLEATLGEADALSKYAWRFRYPGAPRAGRPPKLSLKLRPFTRDRAASSASGR